MKELRPVHTSQMTRQNSGGDDFRIEAWNKSRQTARENDLDFANLKK